MIPGARPRPPEVHQRAPLWVGSRAKHEARATEAEHLERRDRDHADTIAGIRDLDLSASVGIPTNLMRHDRVAVRQRVRDEVLVRVA